MTKHFAAIVAICGMIFATHAQAAGSLEAGITDLATQIVQKTKSDRTVTIGITTFPHADNACSELSNYLSDVLVVSLFDVGSGKVEIIERAQLTSIFEELKFSRSGAVDSATAKELGKIYGVDALVIGSITEIGDEISIIARLIRTETGAVFSAARSSFAKTATVRSLMEKRSAALCGYGTASQNQGTPSAQPTNSTASADATQRVVLSDSLSAEIVKILFSTESQSATFVLQFRNTSENRAHIAVVKDSVSVTDNVGTVYGLKDVWSGVKMCHHPDPGFCTTAYPTRATDLRGGGNARLTFNVQGSSQEAPGRLNAQLELIHTPNPKEPKRYEILSLGLYDLVPGIK